MVLLSRTEKPCKKYKAKYKHKSRQKKTCARKQRKNADCKTQKKHHACHAGATRVPCGSHVFTKDACHAGAMR